MGSDNIMTVFPQTLTPITVPGCVAWLDAADTSTITSSGGAVSSVRNKANANIPFVQGTGVNQPITGTRTINGLNTLDFDGANYWLTANGLISYFTGSDMPFTIFSVCLCDTPTAATQSSIWAIGNSASGAQFQSQVYQSSLNVCNRRDDTSTIATSGATYIAGNNINCVVFTGTTISSYTNATTNYTGTSLDVGTLTLDRFAIGATIRNTNAHFFDGAIGEVIIYKGALSSTDRIAIQRYLGNKWGVVSP